MVSKLVQVVHNVEDKYTPEGSKPSIAFVPKDAPEWKTIKRLREPSASDKELYVKRGVARGMTTREISAEYGMTVSIVSQIKRRNGLGKRQRTYSKSKYRMFNGMDELMMTSTITGISKKTGIPESTLRARSAKSARNNHRHSRQTYYLVKV